jgi:hypothetical protein
MTSKIDCIATPPPPPMYRPPSKNETSSLPPNCRNGAGGSHRRVDHQPCASSMHRHLRSANSCHQRRPPKRRVDLCQVHFMQNGSNSKMAAPMNANRAKWYGADYAKTPRRYKRVRKCERKSSSRRAAVEASHQVLLMMTLAPSLPRTPLSFALGLLSRPFLRLRKPSMPEGFSALGFCMSREL